MREAILSLKKFRTIKPEIRVLGLDDGVFTPHKQGLALMVGVILRGGYWLDGVVHTKVHVDGLDATDKIASMILHSSHYRQLRVLMLNGITCAGFNVVDIRQLNEKTRIPVIAVSREKPDFGDIRRAMKNLPSEKERWTAVQNAGELLEVCTVLKGRSTKIYMEIAGIGKEDAIRIVRLTSTRSLIPEALRVAHLIASGITTRTA